jgi:hypothetical protein
LELKPQIFVAMSFTKRYQERYDRVIAPAIRQIRVNDTRLEPCRVDLSKSGDSILTDILDGIAHSQMVLADVSVIGRNWFTKEVYRNGNVMYEVGLALACRQPSEVLLIRDDGERFLFDVSTIPHKTIDFSKTAAATQLIRDELMERLKERNYINDARLKNVISTLSGEEKRLIDAFSKHPPQSGFGFPKSTSINFMSMAAIPRLLDKQLIRTVAAGDDGEPVYQWTPLGYVVAKNIEKVLQPVLWDKTEVTAGQIDNEDKQEESSQKNV